MKITPVMVEAAAKAIQEVVVNRSGRGREWSAIPERTQQSFRQEAEAALKAALGATGD